MKKRVIISLDISLSRTGMNIYKVGDEKTYVQDNALFIGSYDTTKIKVDESKYNVHGVKMHRIAQWIGKHVKEYIYNDEYDVEVVAEDTIPYGGKSLITVSKVVGVVEVLFRGYKVNKYRPTSVKKQIVHGKATKEDMMNSLISVYPEVVFTNDDEADSIALLITHMVQNGEWTYEAPAWDDVREMRKSKK